MDDLFERKRFDPETLFEQSFAVGFLRVPSSYLHEPNNRVLRFIVTANHTIFVAPNEIEHKDLAELAHVQREEWLAEGYVLLRKGEVEFTVPPSDKEGTQALFIRSVRNKLLRAVEARKLGPSAEDLAKQSTIINTPNKPTL